MKKIEYYDAICLNPKCNWYGMAKDCKGGEKVADTDNYDDCKCPECGGKVEDKEDILRNL